MITIEEIAPYLPYGLKFYATNGINDIVGYSELGGVKIVGLKLFSSIAHLYPIEQIKPIFRQLADLTKEIEVDGEKFVPIKKLEKLNFTGSILTKSENGVYSWSKELNSLIQQLYKWHFWLGDQDRFGKDIIDINTLN